ncbi:MAG: two-component system LytT family response regulator [Halioglobus sp.]|jgi:two-component system LytT family response regulator
MKAYVVEDEKLASNRLKQLILNGIYDLEIIGESQTGKQAIKEINKLKPELIFLDIQLLDMTGFDVLQNLVYQPYIIFTTAYHQYAIDAFDHFAVDYLLKPIEQDKFNRSLNKLLKMKDKTSMQSYDSVNTLIKQKATKRTSFSIRKNDKITLVDIDNVAWIKSEDKYVKIGVKNGKTHLLNKTLKQLENELPESFFRIHRSYIINKDFVFEIHKYFKGRYVFKLNDNDRSSITSSASYLIGIKEKFDL